MGTGIPITAPTQVCPWFHILLITQLAIELIKADRYYTNKKAVEPSAGCSLVYIDGEDTGRPQAVNLLWMRT